MADPARTRHGRSSANAGPLRRARLRRVLRDMYRAAIAAAEPARAIRDCVTATPRRIRVDGQSLRLPTRARAHVLAMGKAAPAMAEALLALPGPPVEGGVVVTKHGHGRPLPGLECREGGHPLPDGKSVVAASAVMDYVRRCVRPDDLVWVAMSGGSSAVCCAPAAGITLRQKRAATNRLLRAGAAITEINRVRKHLSALKGGRLTALCGGARMWTLAVSDVIGDDLSTIGSGPTSPDPTTYADAVEVLLKYRVWATLAQPVRAHLERGRAGAFADTPGADAPAFRHSRWSVVANNRQAMAAAAATAAAAGFHPLVLSSTIAGETRDVAAMHAAIAREVCDTGGPGDPPLAILSGGETVVTLGHGAGTGGRAQEFTLAFLDALGTIERPVAVACVGTDGTDGPTDAAGAVGDDRSLHRAAALGLAPAAQVLACHNAYPWFDALGDLVRTGPTGTNVMDIRIVLVA